MIANIKTYKYEPFYEQNKKFFQLYLTFLFDLILIRAL
jgi:hypothetical protein